MKACENSRPSSLPARMAPLKPGAKKDGCFHLLIQIKWRSARSLKNIMQITEYSARLSQHKRALREYRECERSFRFTSVLGTPAFALKEIFKIIHHSSLFV